MKKNLVLPLLVTATLLPNHAYTVAAQETVISSSEAGDSVSAHDGFGTDYVTFKKEQNIEETVLYEKNDVKITALGIAYGNYSADLHVRLENNSGKNLTFLAGTYGYSCNAVNGWMVEDGWLNEDVASGKSLDAEISFGYSELQIHGITEIAEIQVGFEIEDEDYNSFYTGPLSVRTPLADSYDFGNDSYREAVTSKALQLNLGYSVDAFSEDEIFNSAGVRILSEIYMTNQDGEHVLILETMNDNDVSASMATGDIKVNDTLICEGYWSYDAINPHCRAAADILLNDILDDEEWAEYGISEIHSVSFTVSVVNEDGNLIAEPQELTVRI